MAVPVEWTVSGMTQEGTTPYFLIRLMAISHWPPSGSGVAQQGVGLTVGQILIRKVEDVLKEEICLFQLIVERR